MREVMEALTKRGDGFLERYGEFVDRYDELFCEDFAWHPATEHLDGAAYRGREGLLRYFAQIDDTFEVFQTSDFRYEATGEDIVVALGRLSIRGRGGGVALDSENGICFWMRDGRIASGRSYLSHAEALEAARAQA